MLRPRTTAKIVTVFLTLMAIALFQTRPLLAQSDPSLCYWQSSSGQTIDLSSVCGQAPNKPNTSLQPILKNYSPAIQQEVNQYIQQNKDSFIAQAETTCRTLRYGGSAAATKRRQALISYQGGSEAMQARQETIDAYAIANYCPELK
ncbi:MAG: hypothetical protein HC860_11380 [Alkalinema sp. RU_4_3]|nr:hypothetical protein [Alkalinema sp. RU_4_3]